MSKISLELTNYNVPTGMGFMLSYFIHRAVSTEYDERALAPLCQKNVLLVNNTNRKQIKTC